MKVWFTSDTHFGHTNIIKYCNRPYETAEEMNVALVNNWNAVVGDDDWVVHCGDVAMGRPDDTRPFIESLKGRKIVTRGNHDTKKYQKLLHELGWLFVETIYINDTIIQHHYLRDDDKKRGFIDRVLHGHAHGGHKSNKHIDAGVDAGHFGYHYRPIPATELLFRDDEVALLLFLNKVSR